MFDFEDKGWDSERSDIYGRTGPLDFTDLFSSPANPAELFPELITELRNHLSVSRAVLVIREKAASQYLAVATVNGGRARKNLTLRLPGQSSLFDQVANGGIAYSENFCGLFSGNSFERNLLIDADSQAFAVMPLKSDGQIVGVLGLSSDTPMAFATIDDGAMDRVSDQLAACIARHYPATTA
jgi:transcriptional regulator with GAF, ATPase, and Fis domain